MFVRPRSARATRRLLPGRGLILLTVAGVLLVHLAPSRQAPSVGKGWSSRVLEDCREHDGLPDRHCTPGAIRSGISLVTICSYGYSRAVRPPESYTEMLKLRQIRAYGLHGRVGEYQEDHLVPLSIGGSPTDPANLWPEPRNGAYNAEQKDTLETWSARMACSGRIPLHRLQHEMATDWRHLYRDAGGERALEDYPPGG